MYRLWIVASLVSAAVAHGQDVEWRTAAPARPATPPPPATRPTAPAPEVTRWAPAAPLAPRVVPAAVVPPPPKPVSEVPEFHAVPAPPPPAPPPDPAQYPDAPPLWPDEGIKPVPSVRTIQAGATLPGDNLPPSLPLVQVPEVTAATPVQAEKPPEKSERLPLPREVPADPPKGAKEPPKSTPPAPPAPQPTTPTTALPPPTVQLPSTWTVNPVAACPVPDTRPELEPAPNLPGTLNGVPVRGKTFGSPPIRLSRDFALSDAFGYDLAPVKSAGPDLGGIVNEGQGLSATAFFVEAEYLLWWASRPRIPVLATTSDGTGQGFLGQPGTTALLGPGTFGPSFFDGFRVRAGGWLDDCAGRGLDGSFFLLGRRTQTQTFSGLPTLTRPFFSPNFNGEFGEVVALPNLSTGALTVSADGFLWGADLNYRQAICRSCDRTTAWFAGYRHLNLTETLTMTENITASGPLATDPVGTTVLVQDQFRTYNRFHGGQIGYLTSRRFGRWELDLRASVALGVNVETLEISGFQQRTRPGRATDTFSGGLLATGPNLGQFNATRFSVAPEATVSLGYAVTPRLKLMVGYNFLYWSNVIRPGDQIDRVVDVTLVPNPPAGVAPSGQNRPTPLFRQSDYWTQGITLGAQFRW